MDKLKNDTAKDQMAVIQTKVAKWSERLDGSRKTGAYPTAGVHSIRSLFSTYYFHRPGSRR